MDLEETKTELVTDELKEKFQKERNERLLRKAEKDSESLLDLHIGLPEKELEKIYGKNKLALMKLKQAESFFIRETIGKDIGYSKRSEITGKNGEEIRIASITFAPPIQNISNETTTG